MFSEQIKNLICSNDDYRINHAICGSYFDLSSIKENFPDTVSQYPDT